GRPRKGGPPVLPAGRGVTVPNSTSDPIDHPVVTQVRPVRPVRREEFLAPRGTEQQRSSRVCLVGEACVRTPLRQSKTVGLAHDEQAADLIELSLEVTSSVFPDELTGRRDGRVVLDCSPLDLCDPAPLDLGNTCAGESTERAVEVAVEDQTHGRLFSLVNSRTID